MVNIWGSLLKMKRKFKHRSTLDSERADSTGSLPQPEPHIDAGESSGRGRDERDGADATGERVFSTDQLPQPDGLEPVPARRNDSDQEGREADIDRGETGQRCSGPHPDVEVVLGRGPSGELGGVCPCPFPNGTRILLFPLMSLIALSVNLDASVLPDRGPETARPDKIIEPSAAADEKTSNIKPNASATAELLRGVRDSSGAFGPLKSVARSLCFILDNSEVWPPSHTFDLRCLRSS